jgi:hypothetical protein
MKLALNKEATAAYRFLSWLKDTTGKVCRGQKNPGSFSGSS